MPVKRVTPSRAAIVIVTAAFVSVLQLVILGSPPARPFTSLSSSFKREDDCQEALLDGPPSQDSSSLLEWTQRRLVPPSRLKYNLTMYLSGLYEEFDTNNTYSPTQEFILQAVETVFEDKRGDGFFFVEAGAYDGEFLSNTLVLEKEFGWRGLLVEPNTRAFTRLLNKRRKAWAINACLSTKPYPSKEDFTEVDSTGKKDYVMNRHPNDTRPRDLRLIDNTGKASSRMTQFHNANDEDFRVVKQYRVQCLPLYTLTRALNINHVHFFSLDVEGAEMKILDTIPWNTLKFTMLAIEHLGPEDLVSYMAVRGYGLMDSLHPDYIFVNNNSIKLVKPNPHPNNKRKRYWKKKS